MLYQSENFGKSFEFRSRPHQNWSIPLHIHEYSEFAFTKSGIATVAVDGKTYFIPKDHLIFILPNQAHEYCDNGDNTLRCAVFSNDHVPAFFEKIRNTKPQNPVVDMSAHAWLLRELETADTQNTVKLCGLLNLLCDVVLSSCEWIPHDRREQSLFCDVIRYVSANFKEDIKLFDVAKKLGYNEKYLSYTFHSLTEMNFRDLLASYRIDLAKKMLSSAPSSHVNISNIALECGFSSVNTFNRAFRKLAGMTPTEYMHRQINV